MKKIVITLVLCLFVSVAYGNDYYYMGRTAYENGRYGQAKEYLGIAIKNKPKNTIYRYYYALSLSQLGLIEEAAEQYQIIAMSSPTSNEGHKSIRELDSMKKYFETKAGSFKLPDPNDGNYLAYIIMENSDIRRWNKNQLNVYIS